MATRCRTIRRLSRNLPPEHLYGSDQPYTRFDHNSPVQANCSAGGGGTNCTTSPSPHRPPLITAAMLANAQEQNAAIAICLQRKGYQVAVSGPSGPSPLTQEQIQAVEQREQALNFEVLKQIDEKYKAVCAKPEYASLFLKTPCLGTDITVEQLADSSKITPEQKVLLLRWRTEASANTKEHQEFVLKVGGSLDTQWVVYEASVQPEVDKCNLDLSNGVITWGEYNQKRKDFGERIRAEHGRIFPAQ